MILLLLSACAVTIILRDATDTAVILAVVVLNSALGDVCCIEPSCGASTAHLPVGPPRDEPQRAIRPSKSAQRPPCRRLRATGPQDLRREARGIPQCNSALSAVIKAAASFEEAVVNCDLTHDGSYRLTEHALNARRVLVARAGIGIGKEHKDSRRKIDVAYPAILAWQTRLDALAKGAGVRRGGGRVIVLE